MAVTKNEKPCWHAVCDNCGEGDAYDIGGSFHYESQEELVTALRDAEWCVVIDPATGQVCKVTCFSCWDEMSEMDKAENGACL